MNMKPADITNKPFDLKDVVLRATRLEDVEALTEMLNLPGVRHVPFGSLSRRLKRRENR